jgi:hypothetical protein
MRGDRRVRRAIEAELGCGRARPQVIALLVERGFRADAAAALVDDVQREMLDFQASRSLTGLARRILRAIRLPGDGV